MLGALRGGPGGLGPAGQVHGPQGGQEGWRSALASHWLHRVFKVLQPAFPSHPQ